MPRPSSPCSPCPAEPPPRGQGDAVRHHAIGDLSAPLVEVVELGEGHAWSLCRRRGSTVGDVTGTLERAVGVPVTTRASGTVERVLARAAALA